MGIDESILKYVFKYSALDSLLPKMGHPTNIGNDTSQEFKSTIFYNYTQPSINSGHPKTRHMNAIVPETYKVLLNIPHCKICKVMQFKLIF